MALVAAGDSDRTWRGRQDAGAARQVADQLPSFRDGARGCASCTRPGTPRRWRRLSWPRCGRVAALGLSTVYSIVEFLRTRSALLLVLDNCEHLASAAAAPAADICAAAGVHILATSQQPLGVGGEQVFGLVAAVATAPEATVAAAGASDAVSLFAQRAAAARSDFRLTPANVAAVGEICRRLDGIPLAIELAAARVAAIRPAEIAGLLDERFRLLTRGRADAASRQQTLQATVEVVLRPARRDRAPRL